jgi:hypothetical protein
MVAADPSSQACSAHTITAIPTSHSVSSSNGGDFGTGLRRDRRRLSSAAGAMTTFAAVVPARWPRPGGVGPGSACYRAFGLSRGWAGAGASQDPPEGKGQLRRPRLSCCAGRRGAGCGCVDSGEVGRCRWSPVICSTWSACGETAANRKNPPSSRARRPMPTSTASPLASQRLTLDRSITSRRSRAGASSGAAHAGPGRWQRRVRQPVRRWSCRPRSGRKYPGWD